MFFFLYDLDCVPPRSGVAAQRGRHRADYVIPLSHYVYIYIYIYIHTYIYIYAYYIL